MTTEKNANLENLTKSELIELITTLKSQQTTKSNRKFDVLNILREEEAVSILDLSNKLNITTKHVSSLLTYLRKDGFLIHRDHVGRVYLLDRNQEIN